LAVADAAWHLGLVTGETVLATLARQSGWPGVVRARKILAHADPRRESPLESWSGWAFARTRVPRPEWQAEVRDSEGRFAGRVDCWWPGGVAGEADGKAKYTLSAAERGGGASAVFEVLHAEREREQHLRETGAEIVRWSAADVLINSKTVELDKRIGHALREALERPRFEGTVTAMPSPYAQ
jgi:hypothetical protein